MTIESVLANIIIPLVVFGSVGSLFVFYARRWRKKQKVVTIVRKKLFIIFLLLAFACVLIWGSISVGTFIYDAANAYPKYDVIPPVVVQDK